MMVFILFFAVFLLASAMFLKPNTVFVILSFVAFGVYFNWPDPQILVYTLYLIGIILLIVEFYIPGFGVAGVAGICLSLIALYLSGLNVFEVLVMSVISLFIFLVTLYLYKYLSL